MKQITIYELLGKVYNKNDDMPKIIEYGGRKYEWTGTNYYNAKNDEYIEKHICLEDLQYPVKIIEDNKIKKLDVILDDEIERLPYYSLEKIQKAKNKDEWLDERISLLEKRIDDYHIKINELVNIINEMKNEN